MMIQSNWYLNIKNNGSQLELFKIRNNHNNTTKCDTIKDQFVSL